MQTTTIRNHKVSIFRTYDGTELYIQNPAGETIYAHKVSGDAIERAEEIIPGDAASAAAVNVGYEYSVAGVRYYTAITRDSGIPHCYTVRIWNAGVGGRRAKCNCFAGIRSRKCRHVAAVERFDARRPAHNFRDDETIAEAFARFEAAANGDDFCPEQWAA